MKGLRRTILFVPANNARMVEKASKLNSDMVLLDCEDSVPQSEKLSARNMACEALKTNVWNDKEIGVRINGLDTPLWLEDLKRVAEASPDFVVVPKIEAAHEVALIDQLIRHYRGSSEKLAKIVVAIENAKGLLILGRY